MADEQAPGRDAAIDLRVVRTRTAIQDAFTSLVSERGFDAVTVRDIAERAMVNRATFYRHYRDKHDLMRWVTDRVLADLAWRPVPPSPAALSLEDAVDHAEAVLRRLAAHADLFRTAIVLGGGPRLTLKFQRFVEEILDHRLEAMGASEPLVPRDVLIPIVSRWGVATLSWWLAERMPVPPREMAVHMVTLFVAGPIRCMGLGALAEGGRSSATGAACLHG